MHLSWPHSGFQGINYFDICEDTDITDLERTIPVGSHNFDGDYITMRPQSHRINDWIFGNYNNSPVLLFNCMPSFYADKDENTMSPALEEWRKYTNKECNFYMFSGEHFFIKYQPENVVNKIVNIIMQCC